MSTQNAALIARFFEELCNRGSMEVADQIVASDHVYHDPASPWIGSGPDGMKQLIGTYRGAFPDANWAVEETMIAGDRVVTRWTGSGTHRNDLMGVAPTGKTVSVAGIWIHRIANGHIAESWNVWDTLGMFQQLGAIPSLAKAA